ncbi:MAG: methylmalonyl Co-A mutase-associated GTPase MeaB [Actinophytocola sp.]|uniref:methylmalonyl Co-A mutase-associated GTPase MeaB n=1 Tax=Actinophytocola sp. TaxID=1872138 RepID=UPI003C720431
MSTEVEALVEPARDGQARAVARLISLVEDGSPDLRSVASALSPLTGRARVLGLTGPPGVGKSTSTSMLVSAFRARDLRVGVLAIDPSSPFSGGALLGDRIRMHSHTVDPGVYIRSMATRGALGGLATATPQAVRVLDAAGFDVVLIETVGVGQSEVDIVALADTTVVLLAPGMGDSIQAAKAGILEVADVFVVNKADRDGADQTVRDLKHAMSLGRRELGPSWRQPIVRTVASEGEGVDELVAALDSHHEWLVAHDELAVRRVHRAEREIEAIAVTALRARLGSVHGGEALSRLAKQVAAGETDPYAAADQLTETL